MNCLPQPESLIRPRLRRHSISLKNNFYFQIIRISSFRANGRAVSLLLGRSETHGRPTPWTHRQDHIHTLTRFMYIDERAAQLLAPMPQARSARLGLLEKVSSLSGEDAAVEENFRRPE